jgi:hypothetical protein
VDTRLTAVNGHAGRSAALSMNEPRADRPRAITLGADKAYDAEDFDGSRADVDAFSETGIMSKSPIDSASIRFALRPSRVWRQSRRSVPRE